MRNEGMTEKAALVSVVTNFGQCERDCSGPHQFVYCDPVQRTTRHTAYKGVFHNAPQMRTFAKRRRA